MNPLRLRLSNLGVFRDVDIALPEGLIGVLGDIHNAPAAISSNGSGKSTLVNALVACLFGPSGRSFADDLTRGEDRMEIELTFEQGDDVYRVRRTFTVKGGAKLDFEQFEGEPTIVVSGHGENIEDLGGFVPLTRESLTATQDLIDRTIGLSRSTFLRSVFLSQEDGSFADGAAKEAKTLLAEAAFGPDPSWSRYAARAGDERKRFEVELQQLEGRMQAARVLVATKPELEREHESTLEAEMVAADTLADREREHAALAERWQAAREQDATRKIAEAEVRAASVSYNELAGKMTLASKAGEAITEARAQLAEIVTGDEIPALDQRIRDLEVAATEYERATAAHVTALQQAQTATAQRDTLLQRADALAHEAEHSRMEASMLDARPLDDGATCTHCGHVLDFAGREMSLKSYRADAARLDDEAKALRAQAEAVTVPDVPAVPEGDGPHEELRGVRWRLSKMHETVALRERMQERIRNAEATIKAEPDLAERCAQAYALVQAKDAALAALVPVDLAAIEREGLAVKRALDAAKLALDSARHHIARLDERRVQMTAAEQALAEAAARTAELQRAIDARVRLEKACGLNGVPALILETSVIPFIEAKSAEALSALGTPWQIEIRTQREKKDGALADACETVVITETGESPFRKLSGGEQYRVHIALRVALSELLHGRSSILVIDEPRWLDQAGVEALVESLRGLLDRFPKIYVVTQSGTALRDSFDSTLTVVKDGGCSRVLDGYAVETEAVAA